MGRWLKENKDIIEVICAILSTIVISVITICISITANAISMSANSISASANSISEQQLDKTIETMQPYFTIEPIFEPITNYINEINAMSQESLIYSGIYDKQLFYGYKINNGGGYIQDASVTVQQIVYIQIGGVFSQKKIFYFPHRIKSQRYSNIKNDCIEIHLNYRVSSDFTDTVPISEWIHGKNYNMNYIHEQLQLNNIEYSIKYIEYLSIEYVDYRRQLVNEKYFIGHLNGDFLNPYLIPLSEEMENAIREGIPVNFPVDENSIFSNNNLNSQIFESAYSDFPIILDTYDIESHFPTVVIRILSESLGNDLFNPTPSISPMG